MTMLDQLLPRVLETSEGDAYWFLNNLEIVKATTASTGGAFSLLYQITPPGHATPYHLHHEEDEAFYVLDGEYTFICDGKKSVVGPGGYVFLPRKIPHGIRCSSKTPATMLIMAMPGTGFVGMMTEMGVPTTERTLPAPTPPDIERLTELCEKYKIDILGPLPG
jgi:quercetin dioxygenase-like cupin family protein